MSEYLPTRASLAKAIISNLVCDHDVILGLRQRALDGQVSVYIGLRRIVELDKEFGPLKGRGSK